MKTIVTIALSLLVALESVSAVEPIYAVRLAIDGYDVVAYFNQGEARRGSPEFEHKWQGAKWFFSSRENKTAFVANPEQFVPQYGGYCAYAVARGNTARVDPQAWRVVDGKLYLNFNADIKKRWEKKMKQYIEQADKNWPDLRDPKE